MKTPVNSAEPKTPKNELRRSLLKARQAIPPAVWREKSDRLCAHLHAWSGFAQARTVLAYFSFRQEPDLSPLFRASRGERRWGFSRCGEGRSLTWHHWSPHSQWPLQSGTYGIVEPHPEAPVLTPQEVDLILVPAVACDVRGYRLGYGGGYYDRMLSSPQWRHKPTIGIIFEYARLPRLPIDAWDRPLTGICTEAGLVLVGGQATVTKN